MKKNILISIVVGAVFLIGIGIYVLLLNNNKISIMFNTNSEIKLEGVEIKKSDSINLPTLERDGYNFLGWYLGEEKIDSNYKFDKNTILSAKWEQSEILNYELIVYCSNDMLCLDESRINVVSMPMLEPLYNKDNFDKISIKTKTASAKFVFAESGYVLYEDDNLKIYNVKERKTVVNKLNTGTNAKYIDYNFPYVLYKDDSLKIYNVQENKVINDKISLDANLSNYKLFLNEDGTNVIGISYIKDGYYGYHNIIKNINLYENKYKAADNYSYALENQFKLINGKYLSLHVYNFPDSDVLLLSSEEEKILLEEKTNNGITNFDSYGKNGKYVYVINYSNQEVSNYFRVYSNDFKPMYEGNGFEMNGYDYKKYINVNDYIYILDGKIVKKYDYDGKLLWTSKEYNEPKGLINRLGHGSTFDEYKMSNNYIVYVKNDNLVIENIDDDKESSIITKLNDKNGVGILSYYTKAEANANARNGQIYEEGIYVSVTEYKENSCNANVTEYCYTNDKKIVSYPPSTTSVCAVDKPLIYLYPESKMDVEVKLGRSDLLTTVYPKYNDGWKVVAYPGGKLIDKNTGRSLYGLYWEGKGYIGKKTNEGFVIKGSDTSKFLEEKLEILGLNEREAEEFIIYWLPQMEHNNYNYIRFATTEEINSYMPLEITPKPDTLIRVVMEFMPLEEKIKVKEQKLEKVDRRGFTVVEWGGSLLSSNSNIIR